MRSKKNFLIEASVDKKPTSIWYSFRVQRAQERDNKRESMRLASSILLLAHTINGEKKFVPIM